MPARVARIMLICAYDPCQQSFEVLPWRIGRAKYCSKRCHMLANHPQAGTTLADRFWDKVTKGTPEECWPWQGAKGSSGYGTIYVSEQQRLVGAHVVSWFLHTGRWPDDGQEIMHACPTIHMKACVNFAHLREGTHLENMQELFASDRYTNQFGAVKHTTRAEIVALYLTGKWTYDSLAREYGLSSQSIYTYVRKHRESMRKL